MDFTHSEYRFNQLSLTVQIPQFDLLDPTMGDIEEWRKQVGIDPNRLNIAILTSTAPDTSPGPPVKMVMALAIQQSTQERENLMAQKAVKASLDFQLLDSGQATATLSPVDAADIPTTLPAGTPVPTWTSSDPGITVTAAADGMSATVAPASPPVMVTAAVITATTTLASGTVLTGTSDPIDVVGGGPTGFKIALS